MGKLQSGLTTVTTGDSDNNIELVHKADMEEACHQENWKKYSQTNDTPMMQEEMVDLVGYVGTSPACADILNGTFIPPSSAPQFTKEYLHHLKKAPNIQSPPSAMLTTEEFSQGWSKMKERTSSGLSGIHFGHMKACAQSPFISYFEAIMAHILYF